MSNDIKPKISTINILRLNPLVFVSPITLLNFQLPRAHLSAVFFYIGDLSWGQSTYEIDKHNRHEYTYQQILVLCQSEFLTVAF